MARVTSARSATTLTSATNATRTMSMTCRTHSRRSTALDPRPYDVPHARRTAHDCTCDGCRRVCFEGTRYRCTVCNDFDLCKTCYTSNLHDLSHAFTQIDRPGSSPVKLAPRARPKPTPAPPPVLRRGPPPPPMPQSGPLPTCINTTAASPYFYHDMTIHELKEYLRERGVIYSDILDRETLCRRVWEATATHDHDRTRHVSF